MIKVFPAKDAYETVQDASKESPEELALAKLFIEILKTSTNQGCKLSYPLDSDLPDDIDIRLREIGYSVTVHDDTELLEISWKPKD